MSWPPALLQIRSVRITVLSGPDAPSQYRFDRDPLRVGTGERCDLRLADPAVSRSHLRLSRTEAGYRLLDRGSRNGTWIGGARVTDVAFTGPQKIRVGGTELLFEPVDEEIDLDDPDLPAPRGIVGGSAGMRRVFSLLHRVGPTELPVLVAGETGTGKELISRALHGCSARAGGPFVVFDASAVPENLIEAELFGHTRGAFTGATEARAGAFERADGGTLFIDELGELPLALQTRLLRVLEAREVKRIGGAEPVPIDVRVIAATHRKLDEAVNTGAFRADLYYRIAVVELPLPPLRDRLEDVPALALALLRQAPVPNPPTEIDEAFIEALMEWHWPGNVRELRNVIFRAAALASGPRILSSDLPSALRSLGGAPAVDADVVELPTADQNWRDARAEILEAFERTYLVDLLDRAGGDLQRASDIAGLDRRTVRRLLRAHGLA